MEEFKIKWRAHEYEHEEKTSDWYWAVGIIAIAIAITAVILGNVLFAIFILIGSFSLALHSSKEPRLVEFSVNKKGVSIGNKIYLYSSLDSFWIEEDEIPPKIIIKSKKLIMPFLVIPIEGANPGDIREFLANFLEEEEMREPISHKLMEYLGF